MKIFYEKKYKIKTSLRPDHPKDELDKLPGDTVEIRIALDDDNDDIQPDELPWIDVFFGPLTSKEEDWEDRGFMLSEDEVDLIKRHAKQFLERRVSCSSPEKVHEACYDSIFWIGRDFDDFCVINKILTWGSRQLCLKLACADLEKFVKALENGIKAFKRLQKKAKKTDRNTTS